MITQGLAAPTPRGLPAGVAAPQEAAVNPLAGLVRCSRVSRVSPLEWEARRRRDRPAINANHWR
jgi:hypothetical protein